MSEFILRNTDTGNEREFGSRPKAEEKKAEMVDLEVPEKHLEIVPADGSDEENKRESEQSDAQEVTIEGDTNGVEYVDTTEEESQDLPDRSLTDDPIEWLQQGDGELTTQIKGTTVITKRGFRVLQHKYDISTESEVIVGPEETDHTFCRVKARAEMPSGQVAEAHASAHTDRGDDHFLLVSMADTRAKSRALSDITGVGAVAIEEMVGVEE